MFIANGVRNYSVLLDAFYQLNTYGKIPIYNPGIEQGGATFLWNAPLFFTHLMIIYVFLKNTAPVLLYNYITVFISFISTLALVVLLDSIVNKKEKNIGVLTFLILTGAIAIGLNFHTLARLESFKQFSAYSSGYLLVALVLNNPKNVRDYMVVSYLIFLVMLVNVNHAVGVIILAFIAFLS